VKVPNLRRSRSTSPAAKRGSEVHLRLSTCCDKKPIIKGDDLKLVKALKNIIVRFALPKTTQIVFFESLNIKYTLIIVLADAKRE
jgi:hypothetical protein